MTQRQKLLHECRAWLAEFGSNPDLDYGEIDNDTFEGSAYLLLEKLAI